MQGFKGIYTNANTYQALAELRTLFDRYPLHRIAILTDFCAWWVAEPRLNPISADITQSEELPSEHLIARIMTDLRTPPPPDSLLIITVRHYSWWLHTGWVPLQREERFRLIDSVQTQGALMDSTSNFYVWSLQHRRI
jgi:hypothetical protein